MIMADVFKMVFLVLGAMLVLVAYWLASAALFPDWVARTRAVYDARPVRATLLGALFGIPLTLVGFSLATNGPNGALKVMGALIVSVPILLALGGSTGFALRIGAGLAMPDDDRAPWRRVLRRMAVCTARFERPDFSAIVRSEIVAERPSTWCASRQMTSQTRNADGFVLSSR